MSIHCSLPSVASERKLIREEKKLEDVKKRIEERRGKVKDAEVKEDVGP